MIIYYIIKGHWMNIYKLSTKKDEEDRFFGLLSYFSKTIDNSQDEIISEIEDSEKKILKYKENYLPSGYNEENSSKVLNRVLTCGGSIEYFFDRNNNFIVSLSLYGKKTSRIVLSEKALKRIGSSIKARNIDYTNTILKLIEEKVKECILFIESQ